MVEPKNTTILVVDDETGLRKALLFDFKRKGFNVLDAENGAVALEIIEKQKIDLVLTDVRMPRGGGIELLEKLKSRSPDSPAVVTASPSMRRLWLIGRFHIKKKNGVNGDDFSIYSKP